MSEINIPRPPGLVGELCNWIDDTARKRQPQLSLAASLAFCGALFGRKVQTEWSLRTNLYTMGVAPSCSGKEHARTQINNLVRDAELSNLIGGEDVTSDAAIEQELARQNTVFYLWDEIGHMMGNIKASGGGGHTAKIVPMLMKMYTCSHKTYHGKSYADRQDAQNRRVVIDQPHCCVYGTTVPGRLYDGMDTAELTDGWLGRVLVFATEADPETNWESKAKPVPTNIITNVKQWHDWQPVPDLRNGDIIGAKINNPLTVKMSSGALDLFKMMDDLTRDLKQKNRKEGLGLDNLWGRSVENAQKLALIVACGDSQSDLPIIREEHAEWSYGAVMALTNHLSETIRANVGDNQNDRDRKKIMKIIDRAGADGIHKSALTRKTPWTNMRTRNELVNELVEAEQVVQWEPVPGEGSYYVSAALVPNV